MVTPKERARTINGSRELNEHSVTMLKLGMVFVTYLTFLTNLLSDY